MGGLLIACLLPFAGATILGLVAPPRGKSAGWIASAFVAGSLLLIAAAVPDFLDHPGHLMIPWAPALGLSFSLQADGLSLLFALLISGIGFVVFSFAASYLDESENRRRFFIYLLLFMGAMLGVVFSGNLISLFVFWEMTSITSFLLIGFWHERERSRYGALKALVITAIGGLAMLAGFIMIGLAAGTFEIPMLIERRELVLASPWATPAAILVILGAITKSAQFPFHLWLPTAMEAPTPVSAYLHAATMVKAGLYLVARLGPLLVGVPLWTPTLATLGIVTMAWGSFLALRQSDLKALLAFSTVSQLGLILSMLAGSSAATTSAGLFHLLNHGLFKGALFLLVGVIEHEAHTRDLTKLGPLRRLMPRTYVLLAIGALSMAGVPPLGGFISKEMFLTEALTFGPLLASVAVIGAVLTAGYCFALAVGLAGGRGRESDGETAQAGHDPSLALLWGPALLIAGAIALGLFPQPLAAHFIGASVAAAIGDSPPHLHFALWHGLSGALAASATAIGGGLLLYFMWWRKRDPDAPQLVADKVYDFSLEKLETWSKALTASYMNGLIWRYIIVILSVGVAAVAGVVIHDGVPALRAWPTRQAYAFEFFVSLVTIGAAVGTALARTRLAAILALGASGYSLALLFALLGAPDLALTQIMVETISVALFLAVFVFLPTYGRHVKRRFRPGHFTLALVSGCGIALTLAIMRGNRVAETIAEFFVRNSIDRAGGHNIVNVILVDFRGLDTLGEITVLGVAALACYALIKIRVEDA